MLIFVHHTERDAQENIGLSHLEGLAVRGNDGVRESTREIFLHFQSELDGMPEVTCQKPVEGRVCMSDFDT